MSEGRYSVKIAYDEYAERPHLRLHCRPTTVGDLPTRWHWCIREPRSGLRTKWQSSAADAIKVIEQSRTCPWLGAIEFTTAPL